MRPFCARTVTCYSKTKISACTWESFFLQFLTVLATYGTFFVLIMNRKTRIPILSNEYFILFLIYNLVR